ncbi:MAG: hypothetical protein ACK526_22490 [Planctomyces sp.]|jgi:hypothetical protein
MSVSEASTNQDTRQKISQELTLSETLRVLEVARGFRNERQEAAVALARAEVRQMMRQRLLDAAAITGDPITEADIDAAIDQYFATQHLYSDPPFSFSVLLAHVWIRRFRVVAFLIVVFFAWYLLR